LDRGKFYSNGHEYFNDILPKYVPNKDFIDENFPPTYNTIKALDSLGKNYIKPHFFHNPPIMQSLDYKFKTPSEIFNGKSYFLFKDKIEANDALQGELGNCYLISIISAMAQRLDLIEEAFCSRNVNKDGFYQIYFYDTDCKKKLMFVDHYFPYTKINGNLIPLGVKPHSEEIWVMILEKAYAKYEGGYANIYGGTIMDELFWLTGCFCQEIDLNKSKFAWRNLVLCCQKKYIICCKSNQGFGSHSYLSKNNIANSHAYSILAADEFEGVKLLMLRNPWGDTEWKGDFSDYSNKWTPQLEKYFNFGIAKGENGIFFISFEDFMKEFKNIIICYC